jgi:hypothetical protein
MASGGVFANLNAKDGDRANASSLTGQKVHHAQSSDRPNFGSALLAKADARHTSDPAIRQDKNWM